ncbi:MAG: 4Fe-4S dicluster domain-containing protein [bacterium]|nr:4Fe-4S dicluster domain-containing protein [bacterium]MCP4800696.1 4Fe-4S dicluster domain-containing protein [bacterium]
MNASEVRLVSTIGERCRTCFTCVRECPAKAIRIEDGQAMVLHERCIGCGNCIQVCSQGAKRAVDSISDAETILSGPGKVAAAIAPSFAAEFTEYDERTLAGVLHSMGFDIVHEVGFGADLIADRTRKIMKENLSKRWIATSCPAIVTFVQRYHPSLCDSLLPLVSPMVASARALRELHGDDLKIIFIGPCLAKKGEAELTTGNSRVDCVLTFAELDELIQTRQIDLENIEPVDIDEPRANLGAVFALSRGMVQAAGMSEDLTTGTVVTADGREDFPEALREFESGDLNAELLDILCCKGCIMGFGMTTNEPLFRRRARVSRYVRSCQQQNSLEVWQQNLEKFESVDLCRGFKPDHFQMNEPSEEEIKAILKQLGKANKSDELNCRACGYDACRQHAIAIYKGMAESEMCLPFVIDELRDTVGELHESNANLAKTQEQLMHSERLASMGQLSAGIAHEVNNPLGVVLLYTNLLQEEYSKDTSLGNDLSLIAEQANRCKNIVSGLLDFARENKTDLHPVQINLFLEDTMRGIVLNDGYNVKINSSADDVVVNLDASQMGQVIINLVNNAFAAMPDGGTVNIDVSIPEDSSVSIKVIDTGCGIAEQNISRIFEPFFTTKAQGKGTGLGLAVSYGIVKMHRGKLTVSSNDNVDSGQTGTVFTITMPRYVENT